MPLNATISKTSVPGASASRGLASLAAAAMWIGSVVAANAQNGTEAQREACMPDAFRLCVTAMPDERRVENCLREQGPRLSAACHEVFYPQAANNAAAATSGQSRSRSRQPPASDRMQAQPMPLMPRMPPAAAGDED